LAKPTRVLVATPLGHGGQGGIDRLMDAVADQLLGAGAPGIIVNFEPTRGKRSILLSPFYLLCFLGVLAAQRAFRRLDLVHVNLSSHGSAYRKLIVCGFARLLAVPYILHLHGSDFRSFYASRPAWMRKAITKMFEDARLTLVLGTVWQEYVASIAPRAQTELMPNATKARARCDQQTRETRFLFLGRLGPRKGTPDLLSALHQLSSQDGWTALLAGDGDFEITVETVRRLGLEDRVKVVRWLDNAGVDTALATGNVLVLPSFDENLPMSVIEGMSAGLAIIATPAGATEDIVRNGQTGLIVPAGDVDGLAAKMRLLASDVELRQALGAGAKNFHDANLEISRYASRLVAIWSHCAAKGALGNHNATQ
jgi:glycosyltransferase involved in cell wall biosynthesis